MSQDERDLLERIERKLDALERKIGAINLPPRAVDVPDAARLLGRSPKTVRRMILAGELGTVLMLGSRMVPMSEILRLTTVITTARRSVPSVKRGPTAKRMASARERAEAIRALSKKR